MITGVLLLLCLAAFLAGLLDSMVGGGGLLQTPAILTLLPQYPIATLLGTTKIPSLSGTSLAAYRYARQVNIQWRLLLPMALVAFLGALAGAYGVSHLDRQVIRPIILVVLLMVAAYTYFKKDFGLHVNPHLTARQQNIRGILLGGSIGFYDGLIGPGTGSFFMIALIAGLGNDFLQASAQAKLLNMATNIAAILYFSSSGHILYSYAIPMAVFNMLGSLFGTRLALLKGNQFIRSFFLLVVFGTILRFGYEVFQ